MRRKMSALVGLGLLAGCSGGSGGGDGGVVNTADTTPPAITLTPSSASIEGGETVAITATANDAVDGALTATLTCNGGTLTGNLLVTTAVTADTTITCTGTATDKAGNAGSATTTIQVKATVASVTSETGSTMPQGQFGVLSVENIPLSAETYTAKLGDREVKLYRNGNMLGYMVPADMPVGTHRLDFQLGSKRYTRQITVTAAAAIGDPKTFVTGKLNDAIGKLDALIAASGATMSDGQRAALAEYRTSLVTGLAQLDAMSAADLNRLAVGFQSNIAALPAASASYKGGAFGPAISSKGDLFASASFSSPQCDAALALFGAHVTGVLLGVVIATGAINADPDIVTRLLATGVLVIAMPTLLEGVGTLDAIDKVVERCVGDPVHELTSTDQQQSRNRAQFARALAVSATYGFENRKTKSFTLTETRRMEASIAGKATKLFDKLSYAISKLPVVTATLSNAINRFDTEKTINIPAATVELSSVSDSNILGIKAGSGTTISLTFSYVGNPPSDNVPFTFTLSHNGTPIPLSGQLVVALPGAEDAAVELIQGKPVTAQLQVRGAESIEIVEVPAKGSATISTGGMLSYTPNGQAFGSDQLKYRARNAHGESRIATVLLTIKRQFEGTWSVNIKSVTDSQTSANLCPNENKTVSVFVSKVSDTQYSATYDGVPLNFTMASKDDPNGLKAQVSGTYDDGPGETTETLTVNIPNSTQLNGSSVWFYEGPGGSRCAGQTTITGSK